MAFQLESKMTDAHAHKNVVLDFLPEGARTDTEQYSFSVELDVVMPATEPRVGYVDASLYVQSSEGKPRGTGDIHFPRTHFSTDRERWWAQESTSIEEAVSWWYEAEVSVEDAIRGVGECTDQFSILGRNILDRAVLELAKLHAEVVK